MTISDNSVLLILFSLAICIIGWDEILDSFGLLRFFPKIYAERRKKEKKQNPYIFAHKNNQPVLAREKWLGEVTDIKNTQAIRLYYLKAILADDENTPIDELQQVAYYLDLDVTDSFSYDTEVQQCIAHAQKRLLHTKKLLT